MKRRYWSLAIVLILINYLIFTTLFTMLIEVDFSRGNATRTPIPTFTPALAEPIITVPTPEPVTPQPTPTPTRVVQPQGSNTGGGVLLGDMLIQANSRQSSSSPANQPQLVSLAPVNIRSGPGLEHDVIGTLNANTNMPITGRNADTTWWQVRITSNTTGWMSASVVNASHTADVPLVTASVSSPSLAQPASQHDPAPENLSRQYEPAGWYDDSEAGPTRFSGEIKDQHGNPVDGAFVRAQCGDYSLISSPSGPVGWGKNNESVDWPSGFYELTVDTKPVPCIWVLSVVDTDDRQTVKAVFSEEIPVEITTDKTSVTANWRKNW